MRGLRQMYFKMSHSDEYCKGNEKAGRKAMREKARQKALERKTDNGKNSNGYTGND